MNRIIKYTSLLIPSSSGRKKFRNRFKSKKEIPSVAGQHLAFKESNLAHKYLDGLNGIEIGGSRQNSFGLEKTGGYANVDYSFDQGGNWQDKTIAATDVHIVALGDDLPFKDDSLDYVLSSHVIEHFFDPIKALREWYRVIKGGGFIFIIAPHMDRTFDRFRKTETPLDELINRNTGALRIANYAWNENYLQDLSQVAEEVNLKAYRMFDKLKLESTSKTKHSSEDNFTLDPHIILHETNGKSLPEGYEQYKEDDHHHWSAWRMSGFLELCEYLNYKVIDTQDPDDKVGNGFTVVIQKNA